MMILVINRLGLYPQCTLQRKEARVYRRYEESHGGQLDIMRKAREAMS
jgi:hypothetical protein